MKRKNLLVILFLFISVLSSWAQNKLVKGIVVDANGETLIGVTVIAKNTLNGSVTNTDGNYVLSKLASSDTLVFRSIGFVPQEFLVGENSIIDVVLLEDTEEIGEVQVVAFQKQKKESVIGSITTITPSELKQPSANLTHSLAGKLSGVISYQRSGEPGADNNEFFIHGVTSFGYANSPLILLDGFEISSGDLARIEPDNIASFSIMKDATATALYGARGANGVIMITTKEGRKGKATISARVETSVAMPTKMNEFLDGVDYMELYNQAFRTRGGKESLPYSKEKIEFTRNNVNPYAFPNVNWYNELFKNQTFNTRANLNVNGGGEVAQYYLSASYTNETGLLKVDPQNNFNNNINIDRYNLRANININLTKTTKAAFKFNSIFDRYNGPSTSATDVFNAVMMANPVNFPKFFPSMEETKHINHIMFGNRGQGQYPNPYAQMVRGYKDDFTSSTLAQFKVEQDLSKLTDGLSVRGIASVKSNSGYGSSRSYNPFYYQINNFDYPSNTFNLMAINEGTEYLDLSNNYTNANSRVYFELATIYSRTFNKHGVGGLLVYTQEERLNQISGAGVYASLPARNMGVSGRFTYSYDSRYFIEANFGYNGSERFAQQNRFGFFPSAGLGWLISNEAFFSALKQTVSNLKLKVTYGTVGNDAISDPSDRFLYLSDVNLNDGSKGYSWGTDFNTYHNGFNVNQYPNPMVTWEIAEKFNAGVEIGLFKSVTLLVDYFIENRSQIYLENQYVPATMGLSSNIKSNIGEVGSNGIDASLDFNHHFKENFWMSGRANFTYATNLIKKNGEPEYKYEYLSSIGQPVNQQWGLVAERLFVDEQDVFNSPEQTFGSYMAGDIKYVDVNDDGKVDDNDRVPMGYPTVPEIIYGFGLSSGFYGFDLSFFMQGSARSSLYIDPDAISPFVNERNALKLIADNHWSDSNPDPYAFWPRLSTEPIDNNTQQSSWWLENGAFLRLKTVEIGYDLPQQIVRKWGMSKLRIYFSGVNIFTVSEFGLWDPEMGGNGLGYPPQKVFNIGFNISF